MGERTCPIGVTSKASWLDGALQNREKDRNRVGMENREACLLGWRGGQPGGLEAGMGLNGNEGDWVVGPGLCSWAVGRPWEGEGGSWGKEPNCLTTLPVPH